MKFYPKKIHMAKENHKNLGGDASSSGCFFMFMLKIFCLNVHPERIGENDPLLTWHTFFRSVDQVKKWIKLAPGQLERPSFFTPSPGEMIQFDEHSFQMD